MDRLIVQTSFGQLHVVGRMYAHRHRATLLAIGGAFPPREYLHDLIDKHPNYNVLVGLLPGMQSPAFERPLPGNYAAAYDELVGVLLPTQPVVAYGVSTGALVTLGMRARNVVRHVAEEPFLNTRDLWPFIANSRTRLKKNPDNRLIAEFLQTIFGIQPGATENVCYEHLAEGIGVPADVIVAETALLPVRELANWPSLTSAHDREVLRRNPLVRLHEAPKGTGHHITGLEAGEQFVRQVRAEALQAAARIRMPESV